MDPLFTESKSQGAYYGLQESTKSIHHDKNVLILMVVTIAQLY